MSPSADFPNLQYGPHERNVLDLWLASSDSPTPLVLFIHGGGFMGGDKGNLGPERVDPYLAAGISFAAINYRLTILNSAPAPAAYLDCGRALQFLRHNAEKWNFDPNRIASTGGSAGAGTSMYLAYHSDLADPDSTDPISRQSTRLTCIAVSNGQCSYDPRFAEKIGIPRPNFEAHQFFLPFYGITEDEIDTPRAYELYEAAAPITFLKEDAPPSWLGYNLLDEEVDENTTLGHIVHHPKFGIALKEQLDSLEIECIVQYLDKHEGEVVRHPGKPEGDPESEVEFVCRHLLR